jgi:hypothetical protein
LIDAKSARQGRCAFFSKSIISKVKVGQACVELKRLRQRFGIIPRNMIPLKAERLERFIDFKTFR